MWAADSGTYLEPGRERLNGTPPAAFANPLTAPKPRRPHRFPHWRRYVLSQDHYVRQILRQFDQNPDGIALIHRHTRAGGRELAHAVRSAAGTMREHGIGRAGVVAVLTDPNTPATLVLRWAANLIGATVAHVRGVNPANPEDVLPIDVQRGIVADLRPGLIAVDQDNLERVREIVTSLPTRPILGALGALGPDVIDLTTGAGRDLDPPTSTEDSDIAVVTYTSGSSGRPKGVSWTFGVKNEMVTASRTRGVPANCLITAPLTHSSGFAADDTVITGGLVVLRHGFDAGQVLRTIAAHGITRLVLGTAQVYALAGHPETASTDLSSLREFFYTGSPAAPNRLGEALRVFGPVLYQVYGTSETGLISILFPADHADPALRATVGRAPESVKLTIQDPDDGRILPPGTPGEVCVIGRWSMARYWNEPELTARTIRDGWIHTGDIGHLDDAGYLHLSGRLADVIKVKGIKVYPDAVERVLSDQPGVAQAAVFGIEDADRVERVHAVLAPLPDTTLDLDELRRQVGITLSDNHIPTTIEIRAGLPLIGPAKPDRSRLRAEAGAGARAAGSLPTEKEA
jgi:fatty-acyl-CoA synthase